MKQLNYVYERQRNFITKNLDCDCLEKFKATGETITSKSNNFVLLGVIKSNNFVLKV